VRVADLALLTYDDKRRDRAHLRVTAIVPNVPYGICKTPLLYRQAYMGDHVCVSATHACEVAADNARYAGHSPPICAPPPPPRCGSGTCF
jgi:hypothetical protein